MALCQLPKLELHLVAEIDLPTDGVAIGEDEDHVHTVFHYDLGEFLEAIFVLRGHYRLAVVKDHQETLVSHFFGQPQSVLHWALVELEL